VGWAAELSPRGHKVVVALEDQAPFAAGHGMLCSKAFAASVALGQEGDGWLLDLR
jgi:hypothetical protein